jgi:predicted solute-binding protein
MSCMGRVLGDSGAVRIGDDLLSMNKSKPPKLLDLGREDFFMKITTH